MILGMVNLKLMIPMVMETTELSFFEEVKFS